VRVSSLFLFRLDVHKHFALSLYSPKK
jgi:hypothetical protein